MNRKKLQTSKYIIAFIITTLVFVGGIMLGSYMDDSKLSQIDDLEQKIRMSTMGSELQYLLLSEDPCTAINSTEMAEELGDIGSRLTFMESQLGFDDLRVLNLKEYYSLLEVRHWIFLNKAKKECGIDTELILYFYSNLGDCGECEEQGHVLDYLNKKNPGKMNIYSFDVNINNPVLNTIRNKYGIKETPSLVIDEEVYVGFQDKKMLEELILGIYTSS